MKKYQLPQDSIAEETVVALGDFDGVHKAHKKLLNKTVEIAKNKNLVSAVYMFDKSSKNTKKITPSAVKEKLIEAKGVELIVIQKADEEFFLTSCEMFVEKIVKNTLNAKTVVVGRNYTFGKGGKGTSELLLSLCRKHNIECIIIDDVIYEGEVISSTLIRKYIADGNIEKANNMLGYNYIIEGVVEKGNRIGSVLGFPTANIYPTDDMALPKFGVYIAKATVDEKGGFDAIVNVGLKPTVKNNRLSVEAHIRGIDEELYGRYVSLSFEKFLRAEKKFASVDELKEQIKEDAKQF